MNLYGFVDYEPIGRVDVPGLAEVPVDGNANRVFEYWQARHGRTPTGQQVFRFGTLSCSRRLPRLAVLKSKPKNKPEAQQ